VLHSRRLRTGRLRVESAAFCGASRRRALRNAAAARLSAGVTFWPARVVRRGRGCWFAAPGPGVAGYCLGGERSPHSARALARSRVRRTRSRDPPNGSAFGRAIASLVSGNQPPPPLAWEAIAGVRRASIGGRSSSSARDRLMPAARWPVRIMAGSRWHPVMAGERGAPGADRSVVRPRSLLEPSVLPWRLVLGRFSSCEDRRGARIGGLSNIGVSLTEKMAWLIVNVLGVRPFNTFPTAPGHGAVRPANEMFGPYGVQSANT
jgi:hypothetical protein